MQATAEEFYGETDADDSFKDYLKAMALESSHHAQENSSSHAESNPLTKKCSRCRVKRTQESERDLHKYQTCLQCRARRRVKQKRTRQLPQMPNVCDDWHQFLQRASLNCTMDLSQHNFRSYVDSDIVPRFTPQQLNLDIILEIGQKIVQAYIFPLQNVTGFKFAIRDHHNPQLKDFTKAQKISWMFICSQDRTKRRKSRSENKRQVINKLKVEDCESKINMNYDLITGIIQISYNHKCHKSQPHQDLSNVMNVVKRVSPPPSSSASSAVQQVIQHTRQEQLHHHQDQIQEQLEQEQPKQHMKRHGSTGSGNFNDNDNTDIKSKNSSKNSSNQNSQNDSNSTTHDNARSDHNNATNSNNDDDDDDDRDDEIYKHLTQDKSIHQQFQELQEQHNLLQTDHGYSPPTNDNTPMHHHHDLSHHLSHTPSSPKSPKQSSETFTDSHSFEINIDDNDNVENDVDVAEIARLLKHVQQTASANNPNSNIGLEEFATFVGLGPEDLNILAGDQQLSGQISNSSQNLLDHVKEHVRRNI